MHVSSLDKAQCKAVMAKQGALLWSATTSCQFIGKKIYFTWKQKWLVTVCNLQSIKTFWLSTESVILSIARMVACFPQSSLLLPAETAADKETTCMLAHPTHPSCAWALPQELSHSSWFCIQNLWLSSGIALGSDCQMTGRGSNLSSAAWPIGCKGFICSEIAE